MSKPVDTLKVLHIIPSVSKLRGGPSFAIVDMVNAQRAIGIDARIATTNDHGSEKLDVALDDWSEFEGLPCHFFDRWSPPVSALREFAYSPSFNLWLKRHIHDYDLLHVHAIFSACSSYAMRLARGQNVPYIVRSIGQLERWSLQQSKTRKQLFLKAFEHQNLRSAAFIQTTSQSEYEQVKVFDSTLNPTMVPLGIRDQIDQSGNANPDIDALRKESSRMLRDRFKVPSSGGLLLFLARLHPKKGLERILIQLSKHADLAQTHLVVAGSGETAYQQQIQQEIERLHLSSRVHSLGFVDGQAKRELLLGSDLYLLPSASENFGISVLEALNAGLPALVSLGVGLHSFIEEHHLGAVIDLDDPNLKLGDAIARLFEQPEQLAQMGRAARSASQAHFSWRQIATQLADVYREALGET